MAYPRVAPGADFGTPAARARIAEAISPRYRGGAHFAALLAQAAAFMAAAAAFLRDVRLWEWLLVPAALVFGNAFEWWVHRGPLHHPWPPRLAYNRHTLTHHAAFSHEDMAVRSWRELRIVLFPLFALPLLELLILPVVALVAWTLGRNAAVLFVLSATFYYLMYEVLHLAYHLPSAHPVAPLGLVQWLRRHHQAHHDPQRMTDGNFNVSIPLFDWLLGTRLPAVAQGAAGAPHSSAAEPSGATHTIS
ncbi:MAG TPA: sterol desaturase family protein [Vicinamibacteria bacterium]|nr:sterol desaturase family protein [Vicinamibacteria bacterium]